MIGTLFFHEAVYILSVVSCIVLVSSVNREIQVLRNIDTLSGKGSNSVKALQKQNLI